MGIRTRSVLMAAVTLVSAGAITFTQSVEPAPPPRPRPAPTVRLVAAMQPLIQPHQQGQQPVVSVLLDSPAAPPTALAIPIAPNLANTIDNIYTTVEPWVQYGFEVAAAAVSWIPYVGWLSGQIMVLYNFGESIVASGVFNFTDWLRGNGGIIENVVDFGVDVGLAFVWLGLDEVAQFVPLPPFCCYPPRPPVQGPFLAAETSAAPQGSADLMSAESVDTTDAANQPEGTKKDADGGQIEQLGTGPTGEPQGPAGQQQELQGEQQNVIKDPGPESEKITGESVTGPQVDIDAASEQDKEATKTAGGTAPTEPTAPTAPTAPTEPTAPTAPTAPTPPSGDTQAAAGSGTTSGDTKKE